MTEENNRMTPAGGQSRVDLTSYINTTPRRKCGPTVTSFQNTTENSPPRYKQRNDFADTEHGHMSSDDLDGSVFLSSETTDQHPKHHALDSYLSR